jgi:hypothetical protein
MSPPYNILGLAPTAYGAPGGMFVPGGNVTIAMASQPPIVTNRFGAGDGAVDRAAQTISLAAGYAFPPLKFPLGGCSSVNGGCGVYPASDVLTLQPTLSYNSANAANSSELGNGWSHVFKRYLSLPQYQGRALRRRCRRNITSLPAPARSTPTRAAPGT